jgi:hypothetical protein
MKSLRAKDFDLQKYGRAKLNEKPKGSRLQPPKTQMRAKLKEKGFLSYLYMYECIYQHCEIHS